MTNENRIEKIVKRDDSLQAKDVNWCKRKHVRSSVVKSSILKEYFIHIKINKLIFDYNIRDITYPPSHSANVRIK